VLSSLLLLMFDLIVGLAQIFLGLLAENAGEWVFHRYVLHELGKRPNSLWSYHWSEHHRIARANKMFDPGYTEWPLRWNTQGKEALFLVAIVIVHLPLMAILPLYVCGLYAGLILYYLRHRRSHVDPEWAETHLLWHYEHHLSPTVDANWCVTWPWFDWLMGTRIRPDRTRASSSGRTGKMDTRKNGLTGSDD